MRTDPQSKKAVEALIPNVNAFTQDAKDIWRPEIHSHSLRTEIFANTYIAHDLQHDVFTWHSERDLNAGPADGPATQDGTDQHSEKEFQLFEFLLDQDLETVAQRSGLIWHGHQVAKLIATGEISLSGAVWSVEDLRFALSLRDVRAQPAQTQGDIAQAVARDGAACLAAWLFELSGPVRVALALSDSPLGDCYRQGRANTDMSRICQLCLTRMEGA